MDDSRLPQKALNNAKASRRVISPSYCQLIRGVAGEATAISVRLRQLTVDGRR